MTETMKNRIMIFGPKADGTYVVEFRTAEGEALAISIPQQLPSGAASTRIGQSRPSPCICASVPSNLPAPSR
jgi:hypothetical protein